MRQGDPSALVVMARAPEPGRVKTRLAAALGSARALQVYRDLLEVTARAVLSWRGPVLLAATGDAGAFADTPLRALPRCRQVEGGLGARIAAALLRGLGLAPRAVVIGTDCPALRAAHLQAVAALLDGAPAGFGPATDGGFWAVASRDVAAASAIATPGLPWSSPGTLAAVRAQLQAVGLASRLGPVLADCDDADDYRRAIAAGLLPRSPGD